MEPNSLLTFYSLSQKVHLLDKELEHDFFSWFRDDFIRLRPGYLYNSCDPKNLQFKYQLLIANLKKHGRVLENPETKGTREENEQLAALPDDLIPHLFFSAAEHAHQRAGLKMVQIRNFIKEGERNREFDLLTMVYGLQIPKKDLLEKIAEIGRLWKSASKFFTKTKPLKVEIYDPYFDGRFLCQLLDEKIEDTKYLRLVLHCADLTFIEKIVKRNQPGFLQTLTGQQLKDLCAETAKTMFHDIYDGFMTGRKTRIGKPNPQTLWQFSDRLKIYIWQPKRPGLSAKRYRDIVKNSFHRRFIVIDDKYHLRADHSFHIPNHASVSYDEPVDISIKSQEDFKEWSNTREFEALRLLITGRSFFQDD